MLVFLGKLHTGTESAGTLGCGCPRERTVLLELCGSRDAFIILLLPQCSHKQWCSLSGGIWWGLSHEPKRPRLERQSGWNRHFGCDSLPHPILAV